MINGLAHAHSGLRWMLILSLVYAIYVAFTKKGNGKFEAKDKTLFLATFILSHIQLLLGIVLYIMEEKYRGFSHMKDAYSRFFAVEHTLGMLIAIALITVGYLKTKKITDDSAIFARIGKFYLIALLIILVSIPWPFREALHGHWF